MTARPILFSAPMVRALLAGTKTQTRRVGKIRPGITMDELEWSGPPGTIRTGTALKEHIAAPYAVGHRLYVREAWKTHAAYDDISPAAMGGDEAILYEADGAHQTWGYPAISKIGRFRQGMHMPRWASRLTLAVTDVRVQRLQDISAQDARDEGVDRRSRQVRQISLFGADQAERERIYLDACRWEYQDLWNHLNDARGYGWDTNPWVVAVTFSVERRNIDEVKPCL